MHFTIVGTGAIGSLWGLKLRQAGHQVHLLTRHQEVTLERGFEKAQPVYFAANQPDLLKDSDCIVICVKAFHVEAAIHRILPNLHPDMPVVLMHNGMGTTDTALRLVSNNPLLFATTSHGSLMLSSTEVKHTGIGETRVGGINALGKRCGFLTDVLDHALSPCCWDEHIQQALWHKLAINCMINPLSAIDQIPNGDLLLPCYQEQLLLLSKEIAQVMNTEGIATSGDDVLHKTLDVAQATASNYSSMNRDIFHQRRSEIDFITGYLIKRAALHGIATPKNTALYKAIKNLESSYDNT
ncbi:2-dehydropantoate 2-reductase [Enterovibrio norvegicus FF-454]|uniref:2-dehydropantoate 2-reductase n=1 Tax=Enterovibrio norvegicus FF-454 TaxID=1185651 RepID=A0A1E5C5A2_9GAMM|nr:2-dehydropantoate 2-reductase [Enterovibrio norvegicus]OEE60688.1 2-dehydropantoate 2-reductase [Enterovibrio norvegicus FF-454]